MTICVVVADSSRARILTAKAGKGQLSGEADFIHSESRLREQDLVSDGSGGDRDSGGYGKHSMGHETATNDRQADIFAQQLCDEIDKRRQNGSLLRIYLIAAPKFLGLLRSDLSPQCSSLVAGEINKDLVNHDIDDIRSHLPDFL